jgi:hypothetical protein
MRCALEQLENRQMMHAAHGEHAHLDDWSTFGSEPAGYFSTAHEVGPRGGSSTESSLGIGAIADTYTLPKSPVLQLPDQRTLDMQMGLPLLDSNPAAPVTLYLDFNGNFEADWWYNENNESVHYSNVWTPAFDTDGNSASYSTTEQTLIREIWSRVVEDFAPFNINVSTAYYGTFNNAQALHVVIGGSNWDWLDWDSSGVASIGSFTDSAPNVVYVFDLVAWANAGVTDSSGRALNGAAAMATTISHEAGHAFGLRHNALYKVDGTLITNYNPGVSGWTPIMGDNLQSDRTTWDYGTTDLRKPQDDMAVLARAANGFGYKADDHGNSRAAATSLSSGITGLSLAGKGIINNMYDWDFFRFTPTTSQIQIKVSAAQFGPNLIPVAELWSASGLVARANAGSVTQSIINATIPAGTYYIVVKSFGDYGDVGQYTVSVTYNTKLVQTYSTGSPTTPTSPVNDQLGTIVNTGASLVQDPLVAKTGSTTPSKGSASRGSGMDAVAEPLKIASREPAPRLDLKLTKAKSSGELHDLAFALEGFVDDLKALVG